MHNKGTLAGIGIGIVLGALLTTAVGGIANSLNLSTPPSTTFSYSLADIYNRLNAGTTGAPNAFTEPTNGPTVATMYTLNEIMAKAPAVDTTNGAGVANVLSGATFWGLTSGAWGPQIGTMPIHGAVVLTPTTTGVAIAAGYHDGSGVVPGDADLVAANIVSGTLLFGVSGSAIPASGSATSAQVLTGTSFSNSSGAATGTMPIHGAVVLTPTTTGVAIAAGYHDGSGVVPGDADLVAANIKNGINLFGVVGALYNAGVPRTGQTISYATGDDGDLERGVTLPVPRFADNGNGTVIDNLTGLIWLKNANCAGTRTWAGALTFANALRDGWTGDGSGGDCGLSDASTAGQWRLPNVRELQSLIDYSVFNPALPGGHPFTGVQSNLYWSSTSGSSGSSIAWRVNVGGGHVEPVDGKGNLYYVWPVRGGQ